MKKHLILINNMNTENVSLSLDCESCIYQNVTFTVIRCCLTVDIFPLHSPGYQLSMLTKDPANLDISSQTFLIPYRKY